MSIECFHNLLKDDDFVREFKSYIKELYKTGAVLPDMPSSWANANRQINRIVAYVKGTGSQSRSGKKAFDGWLRNTFENFIDEKLRGAISKCLKDLDLREDFVSGHFSGFYPESYLSKLPKENYRGTFSDFESLINRVAELVAVVPYGVGIVCGRHVYLIS